MIMLYSGSSTSPSVEGVTSPVKREVIVWQSHFQPTSGELPDRRRWAQGGKGESIWDRFSHVPGNVTNGDTGDVACDHYHRVDEDVALMKQLGITTYSFSIGWPRIYPDGTETGGLNQEGLDWYRELARKVSEAGITPMATLYHWDLPQALQDRGGWANPEIVDHFERYARTMFEALASGSPLGQPHRTVGRRLGRPLVGPRAARLLHRSREPPPPPRARPREPRSQGSTRGEDGHQAQHADDLPDSTADSAEDKAAAHRDYGYYTRWFRDPL